MQIRSQYRGPACVAGKLPKGRKKFRKLRGVQTTQRSFRFPNVLLSKLEEEALGRGVTLTQVVMERLAKP